MNQIPSAGPLSPDALEPDLQAAILRLSHANVLIIGDVMLDRYVYGDVNRISVEAPVPILCIDREVRMPGGAGNVLRNVTALGAAAAFITVVGDDEAGSALTALVGGLLVLNGRAYFHPDGSAAGQRCCADGVQTHGRFNCFRRRLWARGPGSCRALQV